MTQNKKRFLDPESAKKIIPSGMSVILGGVTKTTYEKKLEDNL